MRLFPRLHPALNRRWRGSSFCRSFYGSSRSGFFCSRRRCLCFWCWRSCCCFSLETLHIFLKLFLLCVASCSWSLLIISLSLSTSHYPSKRPVNDNEGSPVKEEKEQNPCLLCITHHEGPSKAFARNFHRPLKHILNSVNQLDLPLVSSDLRIHLAILEVFLVQLLKTMKASKEPEKQLGTLENARSRGTGSRRTSPFPNAESKDALRVVDKMFEVNSSRPLACSDQFLGTLAGYPRYKRGFVTHKCPHEKWGKSITIIMWNVDKSIELMKHWDNKNISIFLLSNDSSRYATSPFITAVSPYPSVGKTIRRILRYVSTPYVLLSPGLHSLRRDANFNRMIYAVEKTKVAAASGSIRSEEDGKWRTGCQIFRETEGHMIFERSYSASVHECQLCHFAEGPILIRTRWLIDSNWARDHVQSDFLMPSLFFHLNDDDAPYEHPILVCPDVMFRYHSLTVPWDIQSFKSTSVKTTRLLQSLWEGVARKKHLTRISLASGTQLHYPCSYLDSSDLHQYDLKEAFINSHSGTKSGLRACQEYELKYILSRIDKSCKELKIKCALEGEVSQVLIHVGDPLKLLHLHPERPVVKVGVSSGNDSLTFFREMLRSQDLKYLSRDMDGLIANGKYWRVRITPQEKYDRITYRRVRVLDSLWMNSEFSVTTVDPSFFMKSLNISSTLSVDPNEYEFQASSMAAIRTLSHQYDLKRTSKVASPKP